MIEGIEEYYQKIADSIVDAIQETWSKAQVEAIFFDDSITFEAEYVNETGKLRSFGTLMAGDRAFRDLRRKFKEAGKRVWGQALFKIDSEGKFTLSFGYENCDANGDTIFDETAWSKHHDERHLRLIQQG